MDGPSRAARVRVSRVSEYQARRRHGTGKEQERTDRDELRLAEHVFTKQGTHHVGQLLERSPSRQSNQGREDRHERGEAGERESRMLPVLFVDLEHASEGVVSSRPPLQSPPGQADRTPVTTEAATSAHLMKLRE